MPTLCWLESANARLSRIEDGIQFISGPCDPWHVISGATKVIADIDDDIATIATLAGVPLRALDSSHREAAAPDRRQCGRDSLVSLWNYSSPFTGETIDPLQAIELCSHWRGLIDMNRHVVGAVGFAAWKRETVAPLLWAGGNRTFPPTPRSVETGDRIFAWKSRVAPSKLIEMERDGARLIEVEDGFIRSVGLGADCIPPLSIVVDSLGAYFDPRSPSELEQLLEEGDFPICIVERARRLRDVIVSAGISKYGGNTRKIARRAENRIHILVPGQVEDDRSVQCGGGDVRTNLELLRRVRLKAPGAYVLYKPHPDVEAGHRVGAVPEEQAAQYADEVVRNHSITPLIDMVDEVHVNTSLAGFEALLRGKPVTTHGVPFYAGWGLTHDLGAAPARRTAIRTLDELVSAVLLLYPRYLDPETGLPCTPEILIRRLADATSTRSGGYLVPLRRLQGFLRRHARLMRA